jgi:hypothetical protein
MTSGLCELLRDGRRTSRTVAAASGYATRSSRGLGLSSRPTFAHGLPSTTTTSAVKSFAPRMSDEPTP